MLNADQAREAATGLLQANTEQERRQKEVNDESKPKREGQSDWRGKTDAPDWDTMSGNHSTSYRDDRSWSGSQKGSSSKKDSWNRKNWSSNSAH